MGQYLGIDHGGTKTALLIFDERGHVILRGDDHGIFNDVERRQLNWYQRVVGLIGRLPEKILCSGFDCVMLSLNGMNTQDDLDQASQEAHRYLNFPGIRIVSDSIAAIRGASMDEQKDVVRMVLCAGSGLNVTLSANGYPYQSLGWRIAPRDQGGYGIGRRIWEAALDAYNGLGEQTVLPKMLQTYFQCRPFSRLVEEVSGGRIKFVPEALPPLLFKAARQNDEIAGRIVDELSKRWVGYVDALIRKCCRNPYPPIDLYLSGGLFKDRYGVLGRSIKKWAEKLPYRIRIDSAQCDPVVGCALIQLDAVYDGEIPAKVLVNLRRTLHGKRNVLKQTGGRDGT